MSDQEHSDQLHEYSPGLRSGEITAAIDCSPPRSTRESRLRSHSHSRSRSRSRSRSFTHPYSHSRSHSRERRYRYRSRSRSPRHREHSPMSPRRSYYDDDDRYRSSNSSRARSPISGRRDTGDRDHPEINRCLGVFGLSLYTQERELREVFEKYGPIEDIQVVYDAQSRQSRGFAFIYFENTDDAKEVRERCDGLEIDGRKIRVDYSITKRAHSPTPGVYMGKRTFSRYGGRDNRRYGGGDRGYRDRGYSPNYRRRYSRSRSYSPHRRSYY